MDGSGLLKRPTLSFTWLLEHDNFVIHGTNLLCGASGHI